MIKEANIKHAPVISNLLTEELLKSEILPHLPEGLYISKGEVVKGATSSGDCDLIIYRKPVIYQYGPIVVVPRENVKAIIDVEICGQKFLKAFYQDKVPSNRVTKKKEFADKIFYLGLYAHAKTKEFELWIKNRHSSPIFIFFTRHNIQIIKGEFERLIKEIQNL